MRVRKRRAHMSPPGIPALRMVRTGKPGSKVRNSTLREQSLRRQGNVARMERTVEGKYLMPQKTEN